MFLFDLVPFDEDDKDRSVWFLDHDYLEQMYGMFKKVNGGSLTFESNILAVLCNDVRVLYIYRYSAFADTLVYAESA